MKKLILIAASLTAATAAFAAAKPSPRVPAADLKWEQPMGAGGPSVAFVVGDAKAKGPTEYFFKFPAGFESGWHTHDGTYGATVLKGTITAQAQGEAAEVQLPVGSYFGEPGKKNHRNSCTKESECLIYVHSDKGFTFHPMTPEGKPAPAADKKPADAKPADMKK
jgi:quercetin dioxygenase-like cupin family protein